MGWWLPIAAAAKAGFDAYGKERQRKSTRDALRNLQAATPEEQKYLGHLKSIAERGDPMQNQMMQERMNRVMGNIRQTGADTLQRTEGSIIRQGLENSIVASELRRNVSQDTMKSIAEESRRIANANRMYQDQTRKRAQERMYQMEMGMGDRRRQIQSQIDQLGGYDRVGALGNIAMAGMKPYMDDLAFGKELDRYGQKYRKETALMQERWAALPDANFEPFNWDDE